jgi:uncharacterized membrane protein YbhN (UPF0104 family)
MLIKRTIQNMLALLLVSACILYIYGKYDWGHIFSRITHIKIQLIFFSCCAYVLYIFLRALRWHSLLRNIKPTIPMGKLYLPSAIISTLSMVTPPQIAETLKIEVMRRHGLDARHAFWFFVFDRILDIAVIGCLFFISLLVVGKSILIYLSYTINAPILLTSLILVGAAGALLVWAYRKSNSSIIKKLVSMPSALVNSVFLTLLGWLSIGLAWKFALSSVEIHVSFFEVIFLMTGTMVIIILSFIPGGLGISEVAIEQILASYGVNTITAQTGAVAMRLIAILWIAIGIAHILYWWLFMRTPSATEK